VIDPHDMFCQELVEVLTEYLDGALSAHDRARLEAHLAVCDDCRSYLEQFKATLALADKAKDEKLPPELRNILMSAFRTHDFRI
jgi:anti-sigma factor (TIGR02949 family)